MRRGELLTLIWEDVALDTGVMYVRRGYTKTRGQLRIGPLRTLKAARAIALSGDTVRLLRRIRAESFSDWVPGKPDGSL
jgi:integrase